MKVAVVVIEAVIDDADLDAYSRVVLPRLRNIDPDALVGQPPFLIVIRIRWQRRVTDRRIERVHMKVTRLNEDDGGGLVGEVGWSGGGLVGRVGWSCHFRSPCRRAFLASPSRCAPSGPNARSLLVSSDGAPTAKGQLLAPLVSRQPPCGVNSSYIRSVSELSVVQ